MKITVIRVFSVIASERDPRWPALYQ